MQTCEYLTSTISRVFISLGIMLLINCTTVRAETSLADAPLLASASNLPGNVALVISAEFPTALTYAYSGLTNYSTSTEYLGYFDPNKCYSYFTSDPITANGKYFNPVANANNHICNGQWSGNFLNWATMQSLDPFRQTLSGGNRVIDTTTTTILEKAWSSGQGGYKNRQKLISGQTLISQSTPINNAAWTNLYIRIDMLGNKMWYSNTSVTAANSLTLVANTSVLADTADETNPTPNTIYQKNVRVKVCDNNVSGVPMESNCTQYTNASTVSYKPTGLIQSNATKLRFSAFGYLADPAFTTDNNFTGSYSVTTQTRNQNLQGGVLRAKMAFVGPSALGTYGNISDNSSASEWDASGIFKLNPDSTSASQTVTNYGLDTSSVQNSGVINYLNKFGSTSGRYKVFDRTAELYYAAIRYFKNLGNVDAYTNLTTLGYSKAERTQLVDGFPVFNTWSDPILYSCQKNFILGIGDNNTATAGNLPGSKSTSGTVPSEVSNDNTVNVSIATNRVGALQGLGNIGNGNTRLMAGLAFDAHTRDIRTDAAMPNTQTISTYWLDVLESGYVANNQYELATKFGGFDVPANYQSCSTSASCPTPPTIPSTTTGDQTWDKNSDGLPDNYFKANQPELMQSSLTAAFNAIANEATTGSSISFATTAPSIQSGGLTYASSYNTNGWIGDVTARQINIDSNGIISISNPIWSAAAKLDSQNWNTGRVIATVNPSKSGCTSATAFGATGAQSNCGVGFTFSNLNTSQLDALGSNSIKQNNVLNFLRGETVNEGSTYRDRVQILGDIVNSKVVPIGAPNKPYVDSFNPGYADFKANNASRPTVVYVGANDGMLHAFDGATGVERFAFVPNALFRGPSTPATPAIDGLAQLASTAYLHHFYVDATPQVADVTFADGSWRSILIGGLGKGGKSYFAIDVTNPQNLNTENALANNVLWEFTHPLMGFTYDTPLVVKTAKYGWVVVLTSGYNNTDGKGYIFIVDPQTGALKENPIATNVGSVANDAGLAHINAFVADARSGLADALYAGDLLGNVWRVDVSGSPSSYSALKIASLTTASGASQPVTTSPIIEIDNATGKRYVFIGTGKLLDAADLNSTQPQTFYAINDGSRLSFYNSATLPAVAGGYPITRDDMVDATSSLLTGFTQNSAKPMGYFIDLGTNPNNGKPNFINTELASAAGLIAFAANSVDNTDVCKPTGSNLTYALSYGTGQSALQDASGSRVTYIAGTGLTTSLNFVQTNFSDPTNLKLINSADNQPPLVFTPKFSTTNAFTQLNWRELPTAD